MRTVLFRDVLNNIANLLGIDHTQDVNNDHARTWAAFINSRVRYGWEFWPWPEFTVTEERALRQVWYADVDYTIGDEVYYLPNETYYAVTANPATGVLPTDTDFWEEIETLDRYLEYDQYGKQLIGQIRAIYGSSPRLGTPVIEWGLSPSGLGLDLPYVTGNTVWITYTPIPPQFSSEQHDAGTAYLRGDTVYDLDTDSSYRALVDNTGHDVTDNQYWLLQEFPYILSEYVTYAVASDASDDVQTKAVYLAQAENFLTREVDKQLEQGQRMSYGRPTYPQRWPLGTSGFLWSVYSPTAP